MGGGEIVASFIENDKSGLKLQHATYLYFSYQGWLNWTTTTHWQEKFNKSTETVAKMIHYHTSSYFFRKVTFSEAAIRYDVVLFKVSFICLAGFSGYEFC